MQLTPTQPHRDRQVNILPPTRITTPIELPHISTGITSSKANTQYEMTDVGDAPCASLASLPPELLHRIVIYLSHRRDFAAFTSTSRLHRSFFTHQIWAFILIAKHGKDKALKDPATYGRSFPVATTKGSSWERSDIVRKPDGSGITRESAEYKFGDEEVMRELGRRGSGINDTAAGVALIQAAYVGNGDLVRILRDEGGGDVHYNTNEAMFAAVTWGSADVVEALLENDVIIRERDVGAHREACFLIIAMKYGLPFIKLLFEDRVIDIWIGQTYSWTWHCKENHAALLLVLKKGDVELLGYLLLEHGVELDESFDWNVAKVSSLNGGVYHFLVRYAINQEGDEEVMMRAVSKNFRYLVEALVELGISIEDMDRKMKERGDKGLLETVVTKKASSVVPILLKRLDCPDELIATALGVKYFTKTFLEHKGANTSITKEELLVLAVKIGNGPLISYLLNSNPNINVPDEALFAAAIERSPMYVITLLRHQLRAEHRSPVPWDSLFKIAASKADMDMLQLMFRAESKSDQKQANLDQILDCANGAVLEAAGQGNMEMVEVLLNLTHNKCNDSLKGQILYHASSNGRQCLVDNLLFENARTFTPTVLSDALEHSCTSTTTKPSPKPANVFIYLSFSTA
ncbi:hypothetical protein HK102_002160 [Quaeritorhiza haematococci]|nr:hypothetical protein HK102_002160 [Quaeritorhiza haematococci]